MMNSLSTDTVLNHAAHLANTYNPETAARYLAANGTDTHGIESIKSVSGDVLEYLNTGDSYGATIGRVNGDDWEPIGGWADWLEQSENEYDTENHTTACGYCSHHTPIQYDNWRLTVCESCGRMVQTGEQPPADYERLQLLNYITGNPFTRAFVECLLWSEIVGYDENGNGGYPADERYTVKDIDTTGLREIVTDCIDFWRAHGESIQQLENDTSLAGRLYNGIIRAAGHDFCLTRNGHGAGFWDGDWPDDIGEKLTDASKPYGTLGLSLADDGTLYVHN